ncbi:SET domain-containing protein-lysine N-methyltransferase [Ottowia sp.]|uniref:SET domain-containing protein n=1 Tax=Ottowia sp. TaxID=1898956 RepID=UPI0025FD69A7|nr:SET domain-containing protein-lysine N-methyltransferase [Ottowia sp.]
MAHKSPASSPAQSSTGRRIQVRRSGVHGKGVFALVDIPRGTRIIEYVGEIIGWDEAQRRHPHDPQDPNHTFYFHIDEDRVIDALHGGNASRWINHSCSPNCVADEEDGRIFITARRAIPAGTELNYDYGLVIDEPLTPELKADYPCRCGSRNCRGTLLSSDLETAEGADRKKSGRGKAPSKR